MYYLILLCKKEKKRKNSPISHAYRLQTRRKNDTKRDLH